MKKSGFFLLMTLLLLIPACKSSPPPAEEDPAGESAEAPEAAGVPPGDPEAGPDETSGNAGLIPDEAGGPDGLAEETGPSPADDRAEPALEPAEISDETPPPEEAPPVLPEPDAAVLLPPPEPPPPEPVPQPFPAPPPSPPAPPSPPPGLRPAEEARPSWLRPAEEESSDIVREPEPRPLPAPPEPEIIPLNLPPAAPEEAMVFSRIVRATAGQLVEIPFRGTGWVYLGELGARRGVNYDSRRLDPEGQSFIFRAEAAGTYALKFYKQDFIRDYILNDYVQVIVGEAPEISATGWFNPSVDRGRVSAERWPSALEEADALGRRSSVPAESSVPAAGSVPAESFVPAESSVPAAGSVPAESSVPAAGSVPSVGSVPAESSVPAAGSVPSAGSVPAESSVPAAGSVPSAGSVPMESPPPSRPAISDEGIIPVMPPAPAGQAGAVSPGPSGTERRAILPDGSLPGDYVRTAQEEFNAGRVGGAIAVLDQFRERFPAGSDEAWWLYGQFYEANSPSRDIRAALDYYRRLIREYPQSRRYNDARRRIAYLERYYINIQ